MENQITFWFKPVPYSRFELDGAFYNLLSIQPTLKKNGSLKARFLSKEGNFIHAVIISKEGKPVIHATIETQ